MITAVDAHACGEPGRVITGGVLDVPGKTMFDKKNWLAEHADHIRLRMLREPRGYPASNCNLVLPSNHPDADAGFSSSWSRWSTRRCPAPIPSAWSPS